MNKKIAIIILAVFVIGSGFYVIMKSKSANENPKSNIMTIGIKPSQQKNFSKQISSAFTEIELIKRGKILIEQGKLNESIEYFENLINDKSFEAKGLAKEHLIDLYEKKRDYKKAHLILYADVQKYKIPPKHEFRLPVEERLNYLQFAADGEYSLAVMHAQLALEASKNLPLKSLTKGYKDRLEDLKAAKDYIVSLKNK